MKLPNLFAQQTSLVPFVAGETIFAAGQPSDAMYLVQAGEVELRLHSRTLETVGPEGWFGEMALIEGGVRSADAVARTDCALVPVNERQFLFMVGETPFFALQLVRTLSQRLRRADAAVFALVLLLAIGWMTVAPRAAAQTLTVDQGTSPDAVTTSQTYDTVYDGYIGVGEIDQSAGTFTLSNSGQGLLIGYGSTANGTYHLSGTGSLISNNETEVGTFGVGLFSQSGGSAVFNNSGLYVGDYNGSNGTYNQTGGSVTTGGLNIGYYAGATGAYTLGGGTLSTELVYVGYGGTGTFTQNGGTWTTNGTAIQMGVNSGSTGTLNLNGGTVTAGSVLGNQTGSSNSTLNLNGGTLQAAGNTTNFVNGFTTANVRAGGAIIDSNGFNVTVPQALLHDSALGTTADGGLSKVGLGTLTLTAANTYTGQTSVTAGTLALPGGASIGVTGGTANLSVAGTAANAPTLNVSGGSVTAGTVYLGYNPGEVGTITQSAGTVTINGSNSGQGLFVGYNSNDTGLYTLTGGSLVLNYQSSLGTFGNGTLNQSGGTVAVNSGHILVLGQYNGGSGTYNLSGTGGLSGDTVIVGGPSGNGTGFLHQTGGTINVSNLDIGQNYQGSGAVGTYTLDAGTATMGTVSVGLSTSSAGTVNLNGGTLTTSSVVGQAGTSTFRFNGGTLQPSANNTGFFSGVTNTYVEAGGAVIDTHGFNVTIASQLSDDPAVGYGSDGGLTKNGAGTLTMSAQNLFYGPVTVNAGTLRAGAIYQAFGQGESAVTLANAAGVTLAVNGYYEEIGSLTGGGTKGGTVDLTGGTLETGNDGTSTTFSGLITGSGGLTKSGGGMFTVTANNTYTGTTLVNDGALMVNNVAAKAGDSGTGSGPVYVEQGAWLGGTGTIGGNVTVGANPPNGSQANGVQPRFTTAAGTLTPGVAVNGVSTPGRLTINGMLTFTSGTSVLEADIAGANAGTGYDQVLVGGNLTLAGTLTLTLGAGFTPTLLEKFFLIDLTGTGTTSGTFDGLAQGSLVTDSAGNEYRINYLDHNPADTSNLLFDDVSLTAITVVPEPSTWVLLGLGMTGLCSLTLRRARRV